LQDELLEAGMAWVYPKYCKVPECVAWKEKENGTKSTGLGLWQDKQEIPPWEWRKEHK
jgi:endonuclease YncB( thermonuclease family)